MKTIIGKVVAKKMQKSVVVERVITRRHPLYKKVRRVRRRIKAHSLLNDVNVGDTVMLEATRPISKEKHYQVVKKIGVK